MAAQAPRVVAARELGPGSSAYGVRSPAGKVSAYLSCGLPYAGIAGEPNTPAGPLRHDHASGLHYEAHHAGVPALDPHDHRLLLHGLVDRPLVFTSMTCCVFPPCHACISLNVPAIAAESSKATPGRRLNRATDC